MKRPIPFAKKGCLRLGTLSLLALIAGTAAAQSDPEDYRVPPGPFHHPTPPFPVEMGFSQDHSSTAYEGWQRGRAALIQAFGNYELSHSQSLILDQQERWIERENDLLQTKALHEQQKMWSDARIETRKQRELRREEGLKKLAGRRATVYRQAYHLSTEQFDCRTGTINWPTALHAEKYANVRDRVDELFRMQVAYGDGQSGTAEQIACYVEPLVRELRKDVKKLPRAEYIAAQKFLLGLKLEAKSLAESA
jgi:hypothetical protein